MKTVHIVGARGMLGHQLMYYAGLREDVDRWGWINPRFETAAQLLEAIEPHVHGGHVIINALGLIPAKGRASEVYAAEMAFANTMIPHLLAGLAYRRGAWLIHVSTDCVFGSQQMDVKLRPSTDHRPAPDDLYGRTKLAGEVIKQQGTNIRTSFVGADHGLWPWVDNHQPGPLPGYTNSMWAGSTVWAVAKWLIDFALHGSGGDRPLGTYHLATHTAVSKESIVRELVKHLRRDDLKVTSDPGPLAARALWPSLGFELPSFEEALRDAPPFV